MEAIVLAGGLGTRLREAVPDVPKPMADIGGRPFLSYVLDLLARQGVGRVLLAVGHKHEVIQHHFGPRYGNLLIEYVVEPEQRGTGGAVREALEHCRTADILVLNGDTYFDVDLLEMLAFHRAHQADITIALKRVGDTGRYGAVVPGQDGRIAAFREKSHTGAGLINGGVYAVKRGIGEQLRDLDAPFSFEEDFLQRSMTRLSAYGFESDASFVDIGIPEDYAEARRMLGPHQGRRS